MVGFGGDEGSRRRLPSWMLGVGVAQQREKENDNKNEKTKINCTTISTQVTHSNVVTNKNRCNRLARKRKGKSVNDNENYAEELTVEDLFSIAKEYVEADAVTDELQSLNAQKQLRRAKSLEKDPKGSFAAPNSVRILPTQLTTASCNSIVSSTGATTGDPAQDMLDLFLGPLLKKPLEQEKKTEFTADEMDLSNKYRKLRRSDAGEQIVSPMKTKSSLKDKVAMLLD